MKDYPYLYLNSLREAKRYDEAPKWLESHRLNVACKDAIEEAIRKGFDGMHLDRDCAKGVIEAYGFKRVGWVLSNTIQQKNDDGRFSPYNKSITSYALRGLHPIFIPLVLTVAYAFLSIRFDGTSILDFIRYAGAFLLTKQQFYEWRL